MFEYNALSQYVAAVPENCNLIHSMDPEGNNMLDVEMNDEGEEDFVDLQNSLLQEQDNQDYVDDAI